MNNFEKYIQERKEVIEETLKQIFKKKRNDTLFEAMCYYVLNGGKRLRSLICLAACETVCGDYKPAIYGACAVEVIHSYSLIHDDLPSIDNASKRRGKLTCHRVFGEAVAILAGDALLTQAFEILLKAGLNNKENRAIIMSLKDLAFFAGANGMVRGQILDIFMTTSKDKGPSEEDLIYMFSLKTGALFEASTRIGARLGQGDSTSIKLLGDFGRNFGISFQLVDDLQDINNSQEINYAQKFGRLKAIKKAYEKLESAQTTIKKLKKNKQILEMFLNWLNQKIKQHQR
jgi:geranylgeranyl diphosphate synthase type II